MAFGLIAAYIASCGLAYYLRGRGVFEGFVGAKTLNGFVWALPVLFLGPPWLSLIYFAVTGLVCKFAQQLGHGSYFDLARVGTEDDEAIKPLLFWLSPGYWYDFTGMALTGFVGLLPLGIALYLVTMNPLLALVALAGLTKPIAYEIGWRVKEAGFDENPIGLGEVLFGVSASLVVALVIVINGGLT